MKQSSAGWASSKQFAPPGAWSPYWWLQGRDSLVTYDMAFATTLTGSVLRDDRGVPNELMFHVPGADVRARRVPSAQHVSPGCQP